MAANHTLFIGWNRPIPGKETIAAELFTSWLTFWGTKKTEGKVDHFEPVILQEHGGDLNGFVLVTGDRETLQKIRWEDKEFFKLNLQTAAVIENYGVLDGYVGDEVQHVMGEWTKLVTGK